MKCKQISIEDLASGNIEYGVGYTIMRKPPIMKRIQYKFDDLLEYLKLDDYSRSHRKDYKNGITNDLHYNDTLDKCSDNMPVRMIWVDGFSYLMEFKQGDIDKQAEHRVKRLIADNKVGYIMDDSFGCYLCCKQDEYTTLCKYLNVEYDTRDDNKEFYYNSLFDDILEMFRDYCDVIIDAREGCNETQEYKIDKRMYAITRYIMVNLDRYTNILMSAREYVEDTVDDFWINRLWIRANEDYDIQYKTK